jgi:bifunctional non-homologous end joining protein LigD
LGLKEYRRKRDFGRTPEPTGGQTPGDVSHGGTKQGDAALGGAKHGYLGGSYAIQKHDARRLHYDLRLELDGVLLSWAIPKGPSLDPAQKRLAVRTEDHPLEYGSFEGVIPEGEYGGGTVMLWDRGAWIPWAEPRKAIREGTLKFTINGRKLRGGFTLVRMKGQAGEGGKNWLLIKERDEAARREGEYCVLDSEPFSALSNRAMREIAAARDRVWHSGPGGGAERPAMRRERVPGGEMAIDARALPRAKRAAQPSALVQPTPTTIKDVPEGDDWLHEIELAGRRGACVIRSDEVRVIDSSGEDLTAALPHIARAAADLPVGQAILDGVIVVLNAAGVSSDSALQAALESGATAGAVLEVFDLPHCAGLDLRQTALTTRKQLLARLLAGRQTPPCLRYMDHVAGAGAVVFEQATQLGVKGVVSKRARNAYPSRRPKSWVRTRCPVDDAEVVGEQEPARPIAARTGVVVEPGFEVLGVRVTNPQRVLYPEDRVTKRVLARYYEQIADWILPHIVRRPLSLYRCPAGHEKECFFQKHLGEAGIKHLREAPVREVEGKEPYIALDDARGLIMLAQLAVLEIHPWGSREDNIERPDRMIFDLDPGPGVSWRQIVDAALALRARLGDLGLASWVKTSGGKGLHVVAPIQRRTTWEQLKAFAHAVGKLAVADDPKRFVVTMAKWAREGRVFIDFLRNVRGATCVSAYSTRARPGAAVSTPLDWDELDRHEIVYTVNTLPRRLAALRIDPWEGFFECRQTITQAMRRRAGRP